MAPPPYGKQEGIAQQPHLPTFDLRPLLVLGPVSIATTLALSSNVIVCILTSCLIVLSLLILGYIVYPEQKSAPAVNYIAVDEQTRLAQSFQHNRERNLVPIPPPVWLVIASFIVVAISRASRVEHYAGYRATLKPHKCKWQLLDNSWSVTNTKHEAIQVQLKRFRDSIQATVTIVSFVHGVLTWESHCKVSEHEALLNDRKSSNGSSYQLRIGDFTAEYRDAKQTWVLRFAGTMRHFTKSGTASLGNAPNVPPVPRFDPCVHCELDMVVDDSAKYRFAWIGDGSMWLQTRYLAVASLGREVMRLVYESISNYCFPSDSNVVPRAPNDTCTSTGKCQATVRVFRRRSGAPRVLLRPVLEFSSASIHTVHAGRFNPNPLGSSNGLQMLTNGLPNPFATEQEYEKCNIGLLSLTPLKPLPPVWVLEYVSPTLYENEDSNQSAINRSSSTDQGIVFTLPTVRELQDTTICGEVTSESLENCAKVEMLRLEMLERVDGRGYIIQGLVHLRGTEKWKECSMESTPITKQPDTGKERTHVDDRQPATEEIQKSKGEELRPEMKQDSSGKQTEMEGNHEHLSKQHQPDSDGNLFLHRIPLADYILPVPLQLANGRTHCFTLEDCIGNQWNIQIEPIQNHSFAIPASPLRTRATPSCISFVQVSLSTGNKMVEGSGIQQTIATLSYYRPISDVKTSDTISAA